MITIIPSVRELQSMLLIKQQKHKNLQKQIGKCVSSTSVKTLRDRAEQLQREIDEIQRQILNQLQQ